MYKKKTTRNCVICDSQFITQNPRQKHCASCRVEVNEEYHKEYFAKKYITHGHKKECLRCGLAFISVSNNQRHCKECGPIIAKEREIANDKRKWAEREKKGWQPKTCLRCGSKYAPTGSIQKYCNICKIIVKKEQVRGVMLRSKCKRRQLGSIQLNIPLKGDVAHHINKQEIVYIPAEIHRSIAHNVWTGKNMDKINSFAFEQLILQDSW
jgi:hypothetical protein